MKHKAAPHQMKQILLAMRAQLLQGIADNRKVERGSWQTGAGDPSDLASSERDRELALLLGDRDRLKLREIDAALMRIDEGSYGLCEECGERIAPGRLRAMPFARLCVDCQADRERQERLQRQTEQEPVYRDVELAEEPEGGRRAAARRRNGRAGRPGGHRGAGRPPRHRDGPRAGRGVEGGDDPRSPGDGRSRRDPPARARPLVRARVGAPAGIGGAASPGTAPARRPTHAEDQRGDTMSGPPRGGVQS
ncbi:MAG: TraR/DksA family transcriptional regulator [Deltaproteobacteria bacterium]|nr:TraR/DksA family transcriptional regulator [Deltaproteobacteria bacterium]